VVILALCYVALVALVALLLWERREERRDHAKQIEALCQRIQAPQSATVLYEQERLPPAPAALAPDDDAAFHEARSLTREQMVAELERAE
jgi:hypothetical protein